MRIYLDTNVFITAVEQSGPEKSALEALMTAGEHRPGLLVTSELTLAELLVKPFQRERMVASPPQQESATRVIREDPLSLTSNPLAALYATLVVNRRGLRVISVDRTILILSALRRAENKVMKLPDAIHLATAERTGCTHIVSGDRQFKPSKQYQFELVDLQSAALADLADSLR